MQVTTGVALSAASAVVSLAAAAFAWRRESPGARAVTAFSLATAAWAGGNAVQAWATTLDGKLLAVHVQYVGITVLPVAWFAFAAAYTGRDELTSRRVLGALAVVPVAVFALSLTNGAHHLVRESATLEVVNGSVQLVREFGPAFWVALAYANVVNAAGTVMLLEAALRVGGHYRRQTVVVLAGATVPWIATVLFQAGAIGTEPEAFFGVTALGFAYAIAQYDLFELVPVARDQVLAELNDGVVVVDADRHVLDYNPAAERLLDVPLAAGDVLDDVLPDAVRAAVDGAEDDAVAVPAGDDVRWLSVETMPVKSGAPGEVVLLRDVTELQRQRQRLDRENERLEHVADTISHDLRNPLSVANGYLELAEESGDPEYFDRVQAALDRMDHIVENTLQVARAGTHDPAVERVSLRALADRAWANVPTADATLEVTDDRVVRADPQQLESLLENVFRNAVEHGSTSPGSQTRQDAVDHSDGGVVVTVEAKDDGFAVSDDGVGVPDGMRDEVFDRGYTTSDDGTGLGLSIVRDVADAHGWTVTLRESTDGGARVDVTGVEQVADSAT